jgi:glycosyltransferase involved in cell wall biosynthesis
LITISNSTAEDLRRLGLGGRIDVIPMAVNTEPVRELASKQLAGRLVAIGRLTPSKRYDHAIEALALLRESHPHATLTIVGSGREHEALVAHARRLGVEDAVRLAGSIGEHEKTQLLTDSDLLVGTSAREGWGLTVTEAALRGTPSVVYDVPGFRDSVVGGRTGLLTRAEPRSLAVALRRILDDRTLYEQLRMSAHLEAGRLDWERTADAFERAALAATKPS